MNEQQPACWVIACPNDAGKTTFALEYLPNVADCYHVVNADLLCFLNSGEQPELVFTQQGERREVKQPEVLHLLQKWRKV